MIQNYGKVFFFFIKEGICPYGNKFNNTNRSLAYFQDGRQSCIGPTYAACLHSDNIMCAILKKNLKLH